MELPNWVQCTHAYNSSTWEVRAVVLSFGWRDASAALPEGQSLIPASTLGGSQLPIIGV